MSTGLSADLDRLIATWFVWVLITETFPDVALAT